jgi:hypothetical protein
MSFVSHVALWSLTVSQGSISVSHVSSVVVEFFFVLHFHAEDNCSDGEADDEDDVEDDNPDYNLLALVIFCLGIVPILLTFSVGHFHNLSRCGRVDGVLRVHEVLSSDIEILSLSRERNILVSSEVHVQSLERDEGVEHLRSVGTRGFGSEGIVG